MPCQGTAAVVDDSVVTAHVLSKLPEDQRVFLGHAELYSVTVTVRRNGTSAQCGPARVRRRTVPPARGQADDQAVCECLQCALNRRWQCPGRLRALSDSRRVLGLNRDGRDLKIQKSYSHSLLMLLLTSFSYIRVTHVSMGQATGSEE